MQMNGVALLLALLCALLLTLQAVAADANLPDVDLFEDDASDELKVSKEQVVVALTYAAEVEHSVMVQYLFAAASLKSHLEEFTHPTRKYKQFEMLRRWKNMLLWIAREEMNHWSYDCMMLDSMGVSPNFYHKPFPVDSPIHLMMNNKPIVFSNERFSIDSLKKFVRLEMKHVGNPDTDRLPISPENMSFFTISDLYLSIRNALLKTDFFMIHNASHPVEDMLQEEFYNARDQINNRRRKIPYSSITKEVALQMIAEILEDAEGFIPKVHPNINKMSARRMYRLFKLYKDMSHERVFQQLLQEYEDELKLDPSFEPSRNVISNPQIFDLNPKANLVPTQETRANDPNFEKKFEYRMLKLSHNAYQILLTYLYQWHSSNAPADQLKTLSELIFMPFMTEIIGPLMDIVAEIPSEEYPGKYLAPIFQIHSLDVPEDYEEIKTLQLKRIKELAELSGSLMDEFKQKYDPLLFERFSYVNKSIELFGIEFEYRFGPQVAVETLKNPELDRRFIAEETFQKETKLLRLEFQGRWINRLAVDPDHSNHHIGISGQIFSFVGEPPLDRTIRFKQSRSFVRRDTSPIGVYVTKAEVVKSFYDQTVLRDVTDRFLGAEVDLLGNPQFQGRNHLLSAQKETIDPFIIQVQKQDGDSSILLQKNVGSRGNLIDLSAVDRRIANLGRDATVLPMDEVTRQKNLGQLQIASGLEFLTNRLKQLQQSHEKVKKELEANPTSPELLLLDAQYESRLYYFSRGLEKDADSKFSNIRVMLLERSRFTYNFTLAGETEIKMPDDLGIKILTNSKMAENVNRWNIKFDFGCWDFDAASGMTEGTLLIPIEETN